MKLLIAILLTPAVAAPLDVPEPVPTAAVAEQMPPEAQAQQPSSTSAEGSDASEQPAESESATSLSEAALAESARLAAAGAVELAMQLLGETQPEYGNDPDAWRRHEMALIEILKRGERWQALAERLENLPADLSLPDRRGALTERARALLALDDGEAAADVLRGLIWSTEPKSDNELRLWRRLLIRAWEASGRLDAARTAIQRFQQDYQDESRDWQLARARLALRVMAPEEAAGLLQGLQGPDAEVLQLIAGLWSGQIKPARVVERAVKLGISKEMPAALRRESWAVAAEAANMLNNREARIAALERGLVIDAVTDMPAIVPLSADLLWDAYVVFGQQLGNQLQLIVGDDEAWFVAASNRYDEQPIHARALFSLVALKAYRPEQAAVAHWQLASLLDNIPHGGRLMRALYLESQRFENAADIPPAVRYLLLDHVLAVPDIPLASRLLVGLNEPPPQTDPGEWHLRRARVLLLGGQIDAGIEALDQLFREVEEFDRERALQVVFDLQTLNRHAAALDFLDRLQEDEQEPQVARELLYWRADSLAAMGLHDQAALSYLRSALLFDPHAADPWAQTARFQAAEQLTKAGLYGDARRQYQTLLNSTRDVSRQAVLRNHLQQLQLLEQRQSAGTE